MVSREVSLRSYWLCNSGKRSRVSNFSTPLFLILLHGSQRSYHEFVLIMQFRKTISAETLFNAPFLTPDKLAFICTCLDRIPSGYDLQKLWSRITDCLNWKIYGCKCYKTKVQILLLPSMRIINDSGENLTVLTWYKILLQCVTVSPAEADWHVGITFLSSVCTHVCLSVCLTIICRRHRSSLEHSCFKLRSM